MRCPVCKSRLEGGNFCTQCGAPTPIRKESSVLAILAITFSATYFLGLIGVILAIVDLATKDGKKKTLSGIALGIFGFYMFATFAYTLVDTLGTEFKDEFQKAYMEAKYGIDSSEDEFHLIEGQLGEYGQVVYNDEGEEQIIYVLPEGDYEVENRGWAGYVYTRSTEDGTHFIPFVLFGEEADVELNGEAYVYLMHGANVIFTKKEEEISNE
jgi:hypothetical protein